MNSVHSRIKQRREELGLSMKELAEHVGVSAWQTIQQWEKEGGTAPKRDRLHAVAEALRTTPEFLIFGPVHSPLAAEVLRFSLPDRGGETPTSKLNPGPDTAAKVAAAFDSLNQAQRESVIATLRAFGAWDW